MLVQRPYRSRWFVLSLLFLCGLVYPVSAEVQSLHTYPEAQVSQENPPPLNLQTLIPGAEQASEATESVEPLEVRLSREFELQSQQPRRNVWVEQAPKTWPFPMVTSPARPVLPGSAW